MIVNIDLTKPVKASTDPEVLGGLLKAIVGQPCLKADLSYGEELMLHVGDPVSSSSQKLNETKGSWILGTRASSWRLLLNDPPALVESGWIPDIPGHQVPDQEPAQTIANGDIEKIAQQLVGKTVLAIRLMAFRLPTPVGVGIGLVVEFAGGASLVVVPSPETDLDATDPVADWELFTPFHMYLKVGPGMNWSYLRADLPARTA